MRRRTYLLLLLLWSLLDCSGTAHAQSSLSLQVTLDQLLEAPDYESAFWGALVLDLQDSTVHYARHARQNFIPASVTKLFVTAAALEQLGPHFRYTTRLLADGPIVDGVLLGNLIVRGVGDPAIGGRFTDGDRTATFRAWADSLHRLGVRRITGHIIGDDDYFDDTPLGVGWSWDDLTYWYAAEISALSFNDNCVDVTIEARRPGEPGRLSWQPPTNYVTFLNRTLTIPADRPFKEGYRRLPGTNTIVLFSQVPEGSRDSESLTVHNPTRFFVHVLREVLLAEGIVVEGQPVDVDELTTKPSYADPKLWTVATYTSPPLTEIVRVINQRSQNLYAEMLLRTLGVERPVRNSTLEPGSAAIGLAAAARTWFRAGIDTNRIQLVDGSGLSPQNLVSPEATVRLLAYMARHPDRDVWRAFYTSLPAGGEEKTTLENRLRTGRAHRNVRAKTGTVSNVSALAGYVRTPNGRLLAFAIFCNHYTVPTRQVRHTIDAFVERLARYRY